MSDLLSAAKHLSEVFGTNKNLTEAMQRLDRAIADEPAPPPELTKDDWVEIYYAVEQKRRAPVVEDDQTWIDHLDAIMETIGPDGENMTAADESPSPTYQQILATGKNLLSEDGDNPEYDRAIVELIRDSFPVELETVIADLNLQPEYLYP